jgi:hypothetical protein
MKGFFAKEYALLPLLLGHTVAPDVCDAPGTTFSDFDNEKLMKRCEGMGFRCDSAPDHFRIYARRGGFRKGNQCFIAGGLFVRGVAHPVAGLSIFFSTYSPEPELFLKSLVTSFEWTSLPPTMEPRHISEYISLSDLPNEFFASRTVEPATLKPSLTVLSLLWS